MLFSLKPQPCPLRRGLQIGCFIASTMLGGKTPVRRILGVAIVVQVGVLAFHTSECHREVLS